jgi:hypothetical protein
MAIHQYRPFAVAGGLISYGTDEAEPSLSCRAQLAFLRDPLVRLS